MLEVTPIFWLILVVVFSVFEAATVSLVSIWFAAGALFAMIAALLGLPNWAQFTAFVLSSLISMVLLRPLIKKYIKQTKSATNADMMIGKFAKITESIEAGGGVGRAHSDGLDWAVISENGEEISEGELVTVKAIEGVKLVVARRDTE
jgi:membrane protein implicated in regulation of membrane protease activity